MDDSRAATPARFESTSDMGITLDEGGWNARPLILVFYITTTLVNASTLPEGQD
jgi:hypothetical protein